MIVDYRLVIFVAYLDVEGVAIMPTFNFSAPPY